MLAVQLRPELVWGLVPRFIGLLYVIAFASLITQLELIIGSRGIFPVAQRMAAARRDFPGVSGFLQFPSVLWLSSSDRVLRAIPWLGVLCGLCIFYGGPASPWALALAWFLWLSIEPAMLIFPWDTMLQEVGFLALFLPAPPELPLWEASALPNPTVAFMFRWFVIRLMLGFGKVKFVGASKEDRLYLRGFFVWMPMPTPLGWYAHHAPRWMLRAQLMFMFLAEVIAPVMGFFSGPARAGSFLLLSGLMLGILMTGNWGFFNVGYLLLCVCLLDTQSSVFDWGQAPWHSSLWQPPTLALNALLALMFVSGVFYLVCADSWIGRTFMNLDLDRYVWNRPWARALLQYFRVIGPFRIINGYGVFQPKADPPLRAIPVFEGSDDGGATWRAYRYKYMPTRATDRPPVVAPHHPRLDMASYYAAMGTLDSSFYGAYVGDGSPYSSWTRSSAIDRCGQMLLRNDPLIVKALGHNPFPDKPPQLVRVSVFAMTPTSLERQRATGEWWHVRRLGVSVPARGLQSWPERYAIPEPELFHPDWVSFKRRAPALRAIVSAYRRGMPADEAVIQASDLTAEDVRAFWEVFVPELQVDRGNFERHKQRASALIERFGIDGIVRYERILERFAWLLRVRTERYQYADSTPKIALESPFRFHMFLQEAVSDGREAYLALLDKPEAAAARAAQSSDVLQLWTLTLLRYDHLVYHVCVFRWVQMIASAFEYDVPGIFEYMPLLSSIVPDDEEYRPRPQKLPDGEYVIEGLYPAPESPGAVPAMTRADA
jgi:hypothetical protein